MRKCYQSLKFLESSKKLFPKDEFGMKKEDNATYLSEIGEEWSVWECEGVFGVV